MSSIESKSTKNSKSRGNRQQTKKPQGKMTKAKSGTGKPRIGAVAQFFVARAIIPGLQHEETDGVEIVTSDEGVAYEVNANLTTRKSGIISLAEVQGFVKSVVCDSSKAHPTSIAIEFRHGALVSQLEPQDIKSMFPKGAILVINKDIFGTCFENTLPNGEAVGDVFPNEELYRRMVDTGDGYLIVDSVSSTASSIVVTGARAYFFSVFEEGHFTIREIEDPDPSRRELISLQVTKTWNPVKFMVLKAVGTVTPQCSMKLVESDFGWWGFEMLVKLSLELSFEFNFDPTLEVGLSKAIPLMKTTLISEGISPPPVKILNLLRKAGLLNKFKKFPDLKLGLYIELVLLLELFEALLVNDFGPYLDANFTFGRKEVDVSFVFKPLSGAIDVDADMNERVPLTLTGIPSLVSNLSKSKLISNCRLSLVYGLKSCYI